MSEEIKEILVKIQLDTSNLAERLTLLEAEVSHLTGNVAVPPPVPPTEPRAKQKWDTVWTFGPSTKYNHV